jgi:SAM-dependent methyltransferase
MIGDSVEQPGKRSSLERRKCLKQYVRRLTRPAWLGTIRRTTPLSDRFGYDRGTPIDRFYIERFLEEYRHDVRGRVLEVKDSAYTERYGSRIERCDVLDIDTANPRATIIADLTVADSIPSDTYDCFILTQTLQFIYDLRAAISHAHRILRPGGVLLATVPAVSRIPPENGLTIDYWRLTVASCTLLFGEAFGPSQVKVRSYGNVLTAGAFLIGLAHEELSRRKINVNDEYFPVIIAVHAIK